MGFNLTFKGLNVGDFQIEVVEEIRIASRILVEKYRGKMGNLRNLLRNDSFLLNWLSICNFHFKHSPFCDYLKTYNKQSRLHLYAV
jgi:hypothetical protein